MILKYPIKFARKYLAKPHHHSSSGHFNDYAQLKDYAANELLRNELMLDKPTMVCKFGTTELACIRNYLSINEPKKVADIIKYIKRDKQFLWWWDTHNQIATLSGLFPATTKMAERFSELMLNDIKYIDILCSYQKAEIFLENELLHAKKINFNGYLYPFPFENPWTAALEGKKVLVIHPFEESIKNQYKKRDLLFKNSKILPQFELSTIKAVQTIANNSSSQFKDWFEALDHMKEQISNSDFDIALIGCGAYGLPLTAHVKRMGKKGLHVAGWTQVLFGIYGRRWENRKEYGELINEHWVKPLPSEVPLNSNIVEKGCYW